MASKEQMTQKPNKEQPPVRLTPGPFEVSPTVLQASLQASVGHRTSAFRDVLRETAVMLLEVLELGEERVDEYFPVLLTGTGTAAMESMVAATVPNRRPLVLANGRFSYRLADMARIYNPSSMVLDFGLGKQMEPQRVQEFLDRNPEVDQLLFGVQDTREAILNPSRDLTMIAKKAGLLLCVDAISANVCEKLDLLNMGVDFFTANSGKALGGLPGLGIVCARKDRLESLRDGPRNCYYLSLYDHYRSQHELSEPRFAPAMSLFYALRQALGEILDEGVDVRRRRIHSRTKRVRSYFRTLGLKFLRSEEHMPNSLTSVLLPEGINYSTFDRVLQQRGILVYKGSSVIDDCFQVGTAGYLADEVLEKSLRVIGATLDQLRRHDSMGD